MSFFISVCYLSRAHLFFFLPFIHQNQIEFKVSTKDYPRFVESYGTILKAHMDGLRKRERVRGAAGKGGKK